MTRRFYKSVGVEKISDTEFFITLDGKKIRTPNGLALVAQTRVLAQTVAVEWEEQGTSILPETMPLTQILNTCIDRSQSLRTEIVENLVAWINTDLLCYRAPPDQPLHALQKNAWDPWLEKFARHSGTRLETTHALAALSQPAEAAQTMRKTIDAMTCAEFTALQIATSASGSVVLALALVKGDASAQDVFDAVHVEEDYHEKISGEDLHGRARDAQRRRDATARDLAAVETFLRLTKMP